MTEVRQTLAGIKDAVIPHLDAIAFEIPCGERR